MLTKTRRDDIGLRPLLRNGRAFLAIQMHRVLSGQVLTYFLRFCLVGGVGFLVDAGVLQLAVSVFFMDRYLARVMSFLIAATIAWLLHRVFTFRDRSPRRARQLLAFIGINVFGAALNYGIYAALISGGGLFWEYPALAVAVGSGVALILNFTLGRKFIFRIRGESGSLQCADRPS